MFVPNNELSFAMSDLYPNFGGTDTSNLAVPEADDLDALGEDSKQAENVGIKEARTKNIFVALAIIIALVIFLGGK